VTSFVSPKWVPQMADADAVVAGISRRADVRYAALTPNLRGYEAARAAGADEVAVFAAASERFSEKNINCAIAESIARFAPLMNEAHGDSLPVRGYVSCVTDCPYEGAVAPAQVADVAARLYDLGVYEVSLGDTIGAGTPESIARMLEAVASRIPANRLAGHYHDTNNRALDNIARSLEYGLRTFDAAVGGLGGCPYAPGARGNVATEAVLAILEEKGMRTGIDRSAIAAAGRFAKALRTRS